MKTYFSFKKTFNPTKQGGCALSPKDALLADIGKTREALENAYLGFDNVTDPDLIDCYIYEIDATLKRYRFLMQQAEHMQLFKQYEEHFLRCDEHYINRGEQLVNCDESG